jgi:hypothetical protein
MVADHIAAALGETTVLLVEHPVSNFGANDGSATVGDC